MNRIDFNIINGVGDLHNWDTGISIYAGNGLLRSVKEGDAVCNTSGVFLPVMRFDTIPFGASTSGSNTTFRFGLSDKLLTASPKVVCLGSSTMAGHGLSLPNRLEDRLNAWLTANATSPTLVNYALDGQTLANLRTVANGGTTGRNIETAIAQNPTFIFIDEPTNWAQSYDADTQISYMLEIWQYAWDRGVPVIFGGPRPRTPYSGTQDTRLVDLNTKLRKHPLLKFITLVNFDSFLQSATTADLRSEYDQGDGIHLNATGVQALANQVTAWWEHVLRAVTAFDQYQIQKSANGSTGWSVDQTITDMTSNRLTVTKAPGYFRARARLKDGSYTDYSASTHITNSAPTANAGIDQTLTAGTTSTTVTGSGSDTDGSIAAYMWEVISGSATLVNATTATVTVNSLTNGASVTLRLTVTDNNGATGTDTMVITVGTSSTVEILFNFGESSAVSGYANVLGNPTTAVRSATSNGITVSTVNTGSTYWGVFGTNASDVNGEDTANPTFAFAAAAIRSYIFSYLTTFNGTNYNIYISGFTPGEVIPRIEILGSRDASGVAGSTRLMDVNMKDANGNHLVEDYDVKGNTANVVGFDNPVADGSGGVSLAAHRKLPTDSAHEFSYINALRIIRNT